MKYTCPYCGKKSYSFLAKMFAGNMNASGRACPECGRHSVHGLDSTIFSTALMLAVFVYLIVAAPFKVMEVIPGFADIRPVTLLGPIYALFYGIPGCVIFAVMNLVMDIVSGDLAWSCIAGLLANFAGPFFILYY